MDPTEILITGAAKLGVRLEKAQADAFRAYLEELLKWNRKVNLTAIADPGEIAVKHFLDSLALRRLMPGGRFSAADIGSGAGFPGIPLKIVLPGMRLVLVEPARKKATFLRHVIRLIGLEGADVAEEKIESFAGAHPGGFDVVLSRAFTEPAKLLPLVAPLLTASGRVSLSLGPGSPPVVVEGFHADITDEIVLPHSGIARTLVNYMKAQTPRS
jgi:16S rRNA (guanine527-N7)-methyltransferase